MSEKIFDPNAVSAADAGIFGLPYTQENAQLILYPIPWEATVSYNTGTAKGPEAILEASMQVDLYDAILPNAWQKGIFMMPIDATILALSTSVRKWVVKQIDSLQNSGKTIKEIDKVNKASVQLNQKVKEDTAALLKQNKMVGLVGGDHSTPLGFIQALAQVHNDFGILQLDAHCDLRNAYEGFEFSHASIMYNALKIKNVSKLVQVGIRDYCEDEMQLIKSSKNRVITFFDKQLKENEFQGITWHKQCKEIVKALPDKVYISFDIDALDPKLCPDTGTPVPGGLEFEQVVYLLNMLNEHKKEIIGFDLNEVAPGNTEWNANVGARLLFKLCHIFLKNKINSKIKRKK